MTRGLELDDKRKDMYNAKTFGASRTADDGSGAMSCEPIDCPTTGVRQPLIECMIETSSELEEVETIVGRLHGILFGGYPVGDDCCEKEETTNTITNIEAQSRYAKLRTARIRQELEDVIDRLAD